MQFLDDPKNYQQLDSQGIYESISKLALQIDSGWQTAEFAIINFDLEKIKNIVFVGMGGSNLSAEIIRGLNPFLLNIPFEIVANYRLPTYTDKSTLVILSSYSGNTEEVLSCTQDAISRNAPAVCITTGGKLRLIAVQQKLALIELDDKFNSSKSPRAGIGLSLGALLGLLSRLNPNIKGLINKKNITTTVERVIDSINYFKNTVDNPAKTLATRYKGRGLIIITANHLSGVGKTTVNYLHETAKTFSVCETLPDINHHFLDGLVFPHDLKDSTSFLIVGSNLFPEVIQKRIQITKDILMKQRYQVTVIKPEATDPFLQVFESLAFLTIFSYYLAIVNKVDPGSNPWVDHLKKEL